MRISLNGFDASFMIGRDPAHIRAIVSDRIAQTVECYIQAEKSASFGVSWKCHKTMPSSQGDVWIDGVWVGSRRVDVTQYTGECDFIKAELRHALPSEGEDVGHKFIFNMEAIKEAEKTDDGGAHLINTILGLDASSAELETSNVTQGVENGIGHGGPGELRLVITRVDPLSLPETANGSPVAVALSPVTEHTTLTEHIATFIFKYRSKDFLNKKNVFKHRPSIEKHLVTNGGEALSHKSKSRSSERLETEQPLDSKASNMPQVKSRRRQPKTYKTLGEMKTKLRNYFEKKRKEARKAALKEDRKSEVMTRSMWKKSAEAAVSKQRRAQIAAVNSHGLHDVKVEQVDISTEAFSSNGQIRRTAEGNNAKRARNAARRRKYTATKMEQRRKKMEIEQEKRERIERQCALGVASNTGLSVLVVKEQAMDVELEEWVDSAMQY